MSYCRWSEGDVYAFGDCEGQYTCCCCLFETGLRSKQVKTLFGLLLHLLRHKFAGHYVPSRAFEMIWDEIKTGQW
jgi:hypothetical protein